MASGFIKVHTYATASDPDTHKGVHQKRLLNTQHIVGVYEQFFADRNKDLKSVRGTMIKLFGQEPIGFKETVEEVNTLICKATCDEAEKSQCCMTA